VIEAKESTKKDHILVEAARLFRELGFKASSMRDLAGAVGMEAASLYNHISNKQELLETICTTIADQHHATIIQAAAENQEPFEKIRTLVRLHIGVITRTPEMAAVAHDEWRHLNDFARHDFIQKRNQYEATLKGWIDEGKKMGQLRSLDTEIILFTLLSSLQWLHHWFRNERSLEKEKIENEMVELLLDGLRK